MAREARVGLGLGERLVLLGAWVATCGLVYLLGFYVGKGTQEARLDVEERVVQLPVTSQPPPEGKRPKGEEFVFYDKLMGDRPLEGARPAVDTPPRSTPPARAAAPTPPVPAPKAELPRPTPVARPAPIAAPAPAAPAAKPAPPAARPSPEVAERPAAPVETAGARPTPPLSPAFAPPGTSAWTVLANPTRSREEADALTRDLRGRGYEATLVRVVRDGGTWYRVQVGRFASADQATEMMHRLREREGVSHAFVASE